MNEAWIPAVTALAGVALGELLAHIRSKSTALREDRSRYSETLRTKLEQLVELLDSMRTTIPIMTSQMLSLMEGHGDVERMKQTFSEHRDTRMAIVTMIIRVYAPQLEAELSVLRNRQAVMDER